MQTTYRRPLASRGSLNEYLTVNGEAPASRSNLHSARYPNITPRDRMENFYFHLDSIKDF